VGALKVACLVMLFAALPAAAEIARNGVTISLVAGTDNIGDGGVATEASIAGVGGLAIDRNGNVYFCDVGHNRVRRIDAVSRTISTIAGSERFGIVSVPHSSVGAPLASPNSVALSPDGKFLYIVETVGKRVQEVNLLTTRIRDLGAPRGGFGQPVFATYASSGLLVSDPLIGQVWRWDGKEGWTGVFADPSQFNDGIRAIAEDKDGNLYVASFFGRKLRRWNKATGTIEIVLARTVPGEDPEVPLNRRAGTIDGIVIDGDGYLYFADLEHERIGRLNPETGQAWIAYQSSLRTADPGSWIASGIALDPHGNVWAGDVRHHRVLRFTGPRPEVMAGGGGNGDGGAAVGARLFHPGRVTVDGRGNVFVSDAMAHRIRRIDAKSGTIATVAGIGIPDYNGELQNGRRAALNHPGGVLVDPEGTTLYIGDYYNNRVRALDLKTNVIRLVAGNGTAGEEGDGGPAVKAELLNPHALALDGSGGLLVTSAVSATVRRIDLKSGRIDRVKLDEKTVPPYRTLIFYGIAWNGRGFYLADGMRSSILQHASDKTTRVAAGEKLNYPMDVAVAPDGAVIICDTRNNRIVRWTETDGAMVLAENLGRPRGVAVDRHGDVYVADTFNNRVLRLTLPEAEPLPTQKAVK
jgi:sugar lactone lactonase YvrE